MLGWITAILGPIFARETVEISRRPRYYFSRALYGLALLVALGVVWSSYRPNARGHLTAGSVGLYLTGIHLALAAGFTFWTFNGRQKEYPALAMHPGFLALVTLDGRPDRWFREVPGLFLILPCYWAALLLNIVLVRSWVIRHFDELVGRTVGPPVASAARGRVCSSSPPREQSHLVHTSLPEPERTCENPAQLGP